MTSFGISYRLRGYINLDVEDENVAMDQFETQTVKELLASSSFQMIEIEKKEED